MNSKSSFKNNLTYNLINETLQTSYDWKKM